MPKLKPLTEQELSALAGELTSLPRKNVFGAEEVIRELYDEIQAAIDKGYTEEDLLKILAGRGVELKISSFRQYMRAAKAKRIPKQKPEVPTTQN